MKSINLFFIRTGKRLGCLLIILFLLAAGWLIVGVRNSTVPPVVREYRVESDKISSPVRIVMLADLHGCEHPGLAERIAEFSPDLILCCGDMINHQHETGEDVLVTAALVRELSAIAPVYYSLGNHEIERIDLHEHDAVDRILAEGATLLDQSYVDLNIRGNDLRLGGIYTTASVVFAEPDENTEKDFLTDFIDTDAYRILMEHRPQSFTEILYVIGFEPDLVLSGHLHGGHVILPFFGPLYGANWGWLPNYAFGRFELGTSTLIVSAGLSTERHIIPRVNNPTEITYIILE